jgi:putative transposase
MQNGFVERFNRTFREDVWDAYWFSSIFQYNMIGEKWSADYNSYHPYDSLGKRSPWAFAPRQKVCSGLAPNRPDQTKQLFLKYRLPLE